MKVSNYVIMFCILFLGFVLVTNSSTNALDTITKKQIDYNNAVDTAIEDAAQQVVNQDDNRGVLKDRDIILQNYFLSLYSSLGSLSDASSQQMIQLYTPVFIIVDNDGFYVNYCDEINGGTNFGRVWSTKYPFGYDSGAYSYAFRLDGTMTVLNKSTNAVTVGTYKDIRSAITGTICSTKTEDEVNKIIHTIAVSELTDKMENFINRHNKIAKNSGLNYQFSMPVIEDSTWSSTLEGTSIFAIFQADPYDDGLGGVYNRIAFGGAKITKSSLYYLKQSDDSGILMYHRPGCPSLAGLTDEELANLDAYNSKRECAQHGAYYCEICKP